MRFIVSLYKELVTTGTQNVVMSQQGHKMLSVHNMFLLRSLHNKRNYLYRTFAAGILRLKCDGTRAETRFRISAKRTSPFKSSGPSVQSTSGSRSVSISWIYHVPR
jgi:hypothetical protein